MCNCANNVESAAKEKISNQLPDGWQDLSVELQGYAFLLGAQVSMKNKLNLHIEYDAPKKKGGFSRKKQDMAMLGSYCMFCGEKYVEEDEAATKSAQPKGEPVAWRGLNSNGEVVTEWIDGAPPKSFIDLCGNPSGYDIIQLAWSEQTAPMVLGGAR
jgi:uncharacterized OB-fold protein